MKQTPELGLLKPEDEDFYNIQDLNANADKIDAAVAAKVDKISGKGLSANDYDDAEKAKVADAVPSTRKVNGKALSADITLSAEDIAGGILPVAYGGTGKTSWAANQLPYPSSTTAFSQLPFPTAENSFLAQGTGGPPVWQSPTTAASAMLGISSGTWSPLLLSGTNTDRNIFYEPYGRGEAGAYYLIGKLLWISFSLQISDVTMIENHSYLHISRLPFAVYQPCDWAMSVYWLNLKTNYTMMYATPNGPSSFVLRGTRAASNNSVDNLLTTDLREGTILRGTAVVRLAT